MTIPRWLLPVLAAVAAIAVGITAFLVATQFRPAPVPTASAEIATETVPVLAPLPADDESDVDDGGESDEPAPTPPVAEGEDEGMPDADAPTSPEAGEREVAVPDEDPATAGETFLHLVDLVGLSPDLLTGLIGSFGTRDDDPCAPRTGEPPAGCPSGAPGAVLFDEDIPPLWMNAQAFPQTHDEIGDGGWRAPGDDLYCDATSEDDGGVPIRIRATAPGNWTIRFWPTGHEEEAQTTEAIVASEAQIEDWWAQLAIPSLHYVAEACVVLPIDLTNSGYTAVVTGTDFLGREPGTGPYTMRFNSDGAPQHPGLQVATVGDGILIATALHAEDETVRMQATYVDAGAEASCSATGTRTLPALRFADLVPVDDDERNAQRALPEFTQKQVSTFRVPEGATVLLCARWFPGTDEPTWASAQADFESAVIAQTADRMLPTVTMTGLDPRDDRTVDLDIAVTTAEGAYCDSREWSSGDDLPAPLCRANFLSAATSESADDGSVFDRGFTGDLVLRIDATLSSGETSETSYMLPAGPGSCVGVCTLPATTRYGVATIGGTAEVQVSWETGLTNGGRSGWFFSAIDSNPIDYVAPDAPQIDTRAEFEFGPTNMQRFISPLAIVPVDRPVDYTLTLIDGVRGGVGADCTGGEPLTFSGSSETRSTGEVVVLQPIDLCLGGFYNVELRLTDEDGNTSVWGPGFSSTWWGGGMISVPRHDIDLRWEVAVSVPHYSHLTTFRLDVEDRQYELDDGPTSDCRRGGSVRLASRNHAPTDLDADVTVTFNLEFDPAFDTWDGRCVYETDDEPATVGTVTIPIEDFRQPDGVIVRFPDMPGNPEIHLWADPAP